MARNVTRLSTNRKLKAAASKKKTETKKLAKKKAAIRPKVDHQGILTRSVARANRINLHAGPTTRAKAIASGRRVEKWITLPVVKKRKRVRNQEPGDLPDVIPSDLTNANDMEDEDLEENFCEIVFSGIPEVPCKRWLSANTPVGKKVLEFLQMDYGKGEMPFATTIEEAVDCIEVIKKMERITRDSQHINDIMQVLHYLSVPACPMYMFNHIRTWVLDQRDYMRRRNRRMDRIIKKILAEKTCMSRRLSMKNEITMDVSHFSSDGAKAILEFFNDPVGEGTLPNARTEQEAYECWTLLFQNDRGRSNRTTFDFYNRFKGYPVASWTQMYNGVRPLILAKEQFARDQHEQFGDVLKILQVKKEADLAAKRASETQTGQSSSPEPEYNTENY